VRLLGHSPVPTADSELSSYTSGTWLGRIAALRQIQLVFDAPSDEIEIISLQRLVELPRFFDPLAALFRCAASVREFCALAFAHAGIDMDAHVVVDPSNFRPAEVDCPRGEAAKARRAHGWAPRRALHETLLDVLEDCRARLRAAGAP
jgi:hypothetical protein